MILIKDIEEKQWKMAAFGAAAILGAYVAYRAIKGSTADNSVETGNAETPKAEAEGTSAGEKKFVYIGTYTMKLGHILGDQVGEGVYCFELNDDGSMTQ